MKTKLPSSEGDPPVGAALDLLQVVGSVPEHQLHARLEQLVGDAPLPRAAPGVVRAPVRKGDRQEIGIDGLESADLLGDARGVEETDARPAAAVCACVARSPGRQIAGEDRNAQRSVGAGELDQERPFHLRVGSTASHAPDAMAIECPQRLLQSGDAVVEAVVVGDRDDGNVVAGQVKGRLYDVPPVDEGLAAFER